jgi:hypothetical protein
MSQRGQLVSGSQPPVQLLSGASANFNEDYTQDYDYEASVLGGAGDATLSSVEASFDRLWQSVSYRDRAQFAAYVRAEVDRDSSSSSSTSTLSTSRSSNGVHLLSGDHFPSFSYLHKAFAAYGRLPVWWRSVLDRFYLLAGLLFLQSCSSLILSHFADFIQKHVIVTVSAHTKAGG